jgi:hypothetical protein
MDARIMMLSRLSHPYLRYLSLQETFQLDIPEVYNLVS